MTRVAVLSDGIVNQIAAGEVVERPASVLKELVDNALDADADRIEVTIESAGSERITVADDGLGMNREDALAALERHATSKIATADDLARVATLGFRGEALPSIAAVSRLTLETSPADGAEGTRLRVDGGDRRGVERIARARGTTVDVRHLFYNTPARRKFLKTHATEQSHNVHYVNEQALARPRVAWRVVHGRREILDLPAAGSLRERLVGLFGKPYVDSLLPLVGMEGDVRVRGFVQRSAAAGTSRGRQHVFVNGRPIESPRVARAVRSGYRSTLPRGARPDLFVFLEIDPAEVDVNVHPAKREVRFRRPSSVAGVVEEAVRRTLGSGPLAARPYRVPRAGGPAEAAPPGRGQLGLFYARPAAVRDAVEAGTPGIREQSVPAGDSPEREIGVRSPAPTTGIEASDRHGVVRPALWQLHERFILVQTRSGLAVVDQHSAHERVLYEEVIEGLRQGPREGQRLLFPSVLHLSPRHYATWEEYRGLIDLLGFEIEAFGGNAIAIATVPSFRHPFDVEEALGGLLEDLSDPGGGSADMNQHERVARLFACKAAVKAGQALAPEEMTELIDRLFATRLPYDDVHGRPAVLQIDLSDLQRHFGRH